MTATLITGGGIDLTSGRYRLNSIDFGTPNRTKNIFQPPVAGTIPQLASFYDGLTQSVFHLRVWGNDADDLQDALDAVVAEFSAYDVETTYGGDNWLEYGLGGATKHIVTMASEMAAVPLAGAQGNLPGLLLAVEDFIIPDWPLTISHLASFYEDLGSTATIVG